MRTFKVDEIILISYDGFLAINPRSPEDLERTGFIGRVTEVLSSTRYSLSGWQISGGRKEQRILNSDLENQTALELEHEIHADGCNRFVASFNENRVVCNTEENEAMMLYKAGKRSQEYRLKLEQTITKLKNRQ